MEKQEYIDAIIKSMKTDAERREDFEDQIISEVAEMLSKDNDKERRKYFNLNVKGYVKSLQKFDTDLMESIEDKLNDLKDLDDKND